MAETKEEKQAKADQEEAAEKGVSVQTIQGPEPTSVESEKAPLRRSIPPQPVSLVSKEAQDYQRTQDPDDHRSAILRAPGYEENSEIAVTPPLDDRSESAAKAAAKGVK